MGHGIVETIGKFTVAVVLASLWTTGAWGNDARSLVIVIDGLRPDYITPELAPNLYALGERGVFGIKHTAIYPTYTRPNSASVSTGSFPRTHGLIHNHMWDPVMGEDRFSTGTASNLREYDEATGGELLTTVTLAEVLDENGVDFFVTGTGGSGTTLMLNRFGTGKGVWQGRGVFIPSEGEEAAIEALGELPEDPRGPEGTDWSFDAYLHHALSDDPPAVTFMWINEPDSTGHSYGVGAPETLEAVASSDRNIGRIVEAHEEHGLTDKVNIFVTSDHGFSTTLGGLNVGRTLEEAGLDGDGVRVVRNMVWVEEGGAARLADIAEALQRDENVGNVYTRPARHGSSEGIAPGTLSTDVIQWNHPRSADLIASPAWTDEENEFGFAGTTTFGGTATHGSDSPFDLQIMLVAAGPDIKQGVRSEVPTSNVDLAPTVLHLHGIRPPYQMDGRIMREILVDGPNPADVPVHEHLHRAAVTYPDGFRYEAEMEVLRVGRTFYTRGADTARSTE